MTRPRVSWSLADWLAWLETLSPREIDLGLARVSTMLERLDLARPQTVLHVAGTNGKGSCAAMLESLLLTAGEGVGCYTSPHMLRYNERIRVDGRAADDDAIVAAFHAVEAERGGLPLTYFEYGTLAALVVFAARGAERLVLEIGLGGRLDAVNAVEPDGAIITNVTLEHCDWLGSDVESIAREKAGVMRRGKPAVFGGEPVPETIRSEARRIGADLRLAGRDYRFRAAARGDGWCWHGRDTALPDLAPLGLQGAFQRRNAAAVLALLEALGFRDLLDAGRINRALGRLRVPGRLQRISTAREWLLDVAHNPDAARVLGESLEAMHWPGTVVAVIGVLADKDLAGIVGPLAPQVSRWVAVTAAHGRARPARELAEDIARLTGKPCLVGGEIGEAMARLQRCARDEALVLVSGSFYTVGPALEWLERQGAAVAAA